jgi:hypothetical protein
LAANASTFGVMSILSVSLILITMIPHPFGEADFLASPMRKSAMVWSEMPDNWCSWSETHVMKSDKDTATENKVNYKGKALMAKP